MTMTMIVEDSQTPILELVREGSCGVSLTRTEESFSSPKRPNRCQSSISDEENILMSPSARRAILETRRIQELVAAQTPILELAHEGSSGVSLTSTEESFSSPKWPNNCQSSISDEENILMSPSARRAFLETRTIQERVDALRTPHFSGLLPSSNSGDSGDNTKEDGQKDPYVFDLIENTGTSARRLSPATGEAWQQMAQAPLAKSGSVPEIRGQFSSGNTNTRPQKQPPAAALSLQEKTRKNHDSLLPYHYPDTRPQGGNHGVPQKQDLPLEVVLLVVIRLLAIIVSRGAL
jgi:hypothetical protein